MTIHTQYRIPHMVITKEDILSIIPRSDTFTRKMVEELSDDSMQHIADKMTDGMMETYWVVLKDATYDVLEITDQKREQNE